VSIDLDEHETAAVRACAARGITRDREGKLTLSPEAKRAYASANAIVNARYGRRADRWPRVQLARFEVHGPTASGSAAPLTAEDTDWGEHDDLANVPRREP